MRFGITPEVNSVVILALTSAIIIGAMVGCYIASDFLKNLYETHPFFSKLRKSQYDWPVIIFFLSMWILPITAAYLYSLWK